MAGRLVQFQQGGEALPGAWSPVVVLGGGHRSCRVYELCQPLSHPQTSLALGLCSPFLSVVPSAERGVG